jgi:MerR family transcriptional regulator/heat shock protein HspR
MARVTRQIKALYELCAIAIVESRANLDGAVDVGFDIDLPLFTVGRAGELANIHPQTLRQYDRQGLIMPQRTEGGARRYSLRDIDRLVQAQHFSQNEGINLSGIARILSLQEENRQLRREVKRLNVPEGSSIFTADTEGGITEIQRSRQTRRWRREIYVRTRELTAGYHDSSELADDSATEDSGSHGLVDGSHSDSKAGNGPDSKSMVLWSQYLD